MSSEHHLKWTLHTEGTFEELRRFFTGFRRGEFPPPGGEPGDVTIPSPYSPFDVSPFPTSSSIYVMNGYSDSTIRIRSSGEELFLAFEDENTSIAASAPVLPDKQVLDRGAFVPVPPPLDPLAFYPKSTPDQYKNQTSTLLMQVISMNMKEKEGKKARLLIGVPYAESFPEIFFNSEVFLKGEDKNLNASSYGVVQSLTFFKNRVAGVVDAISNGFPARSFFGIYHMIETPVGNFFNKKATQMELQPDNEGKLALALPPIPFKYELINGPIPLYDANNPSGEPVADLIAAHHHATRSAERATSDAWPFHQPDLNKILPIKRGFTKD